MTHFGLPPKEGLYDPAQEHDACGIGFVADLRREASHDIVAMGTEILCHLTHRGASGSDELTGDGAGLLLQTPDRFLRRVADESGFGLPALGAYASALVFLSTDAAEGAWQKEVMRNALFDGLSIASLPPPGCSCALIRASRSRRSKRSG